MGEGFGLKNTSDRLNYYIEVLMYDNFKNEIEKGFTLNKILYCFDKRHLQTDYSKDILNKLDINHIKDLIEHDCGQLECRINFMIGLIYNRPELNYNFFTMYTEKLIFDKVKQSDDAYKEYINEEIQELEKAITIKNILSLKDYNTSKIIPYIKEINIKNIDDIFDINLLKEVDLSILNKISNQLTRNYLDTIKRTEDELIEKMYNTSNKQLFFK